MIFIILNNLTQFLNNTKLSQIFTTMKIYRLKPIDQKSNEMQDIANKNGTTVSTCGYITSAICHYIAQQTNVTSETFKQIDLKLLTPYIEKCMKRIAQCRKQQIKKFYTQMTQHQRKYYLKDWVATHEIEDYLGFISQQIITQPIYFFRQVAYDHPQALSQVKFEQAERVKIQQQFKGQMYFYTRITSKSVTHHKKQQFEQQLKQWIKQRPKQPVIIATDVLGHFNTTILLQGNIYILDSLMGARQYKVDTLTQHNYDVNIYKVIEYYYKQAYLVKEQQK